MRTFRLYVSGIVYGVLELEENGVRIQALDPTTAEFSPAHPLTEEENEFFRRFVHMDLAAMPALFAACEQGFSGKPEETDLKDGRRYCSEDGCWYMQREVKFPNNVLMEGGRVVAVACPTREMAVFLVEDGWEEKTVLGRWKEVWADQPIYPVRYAGMFSVPMRDGVKLSTDVYLPEGIGEGVPAVLVRTPYGKEENRESYYRYVQRGYAVVIQDVRGRNLSEGEWIPNYYEVEDGDDTLSWIAAQNWSNQRVGMVGGSYLGYVQWAAAASGNPYLKALISVVCAGSPFVDLPRRGGALTSGMMAWAFSVSRQKFCPELMERSDWEEVLDIRPIGAIAEKALGYRVPFLEKWADGGDYNDFWRRSNWRERSVGARIPALIQSGWFDDNGMGTTEALELVHDYPEGMRKVILGPWQHSGNSRYDLHGVPFGNNALRFDLDFIYFQWFEHFLKDVDNGIEKTAPVEYYTVGENRWKTAGNWPVPDTRVEALYLDSKEGANTSSGDGALSWSAPENEAFDGYDYDPENPSTHIIDMSENEIEVPEDYTEEEKRQDILCYTTEPLENDLVITGDLTVELFVSSDAPDTDFVVRLTDVDERGRSIKLADGILSARYRNGFAKAEFMEPGQVYPLSIRTTKISNCFRRGHRIRLTVTSSAKNFIFPNSNTREGFNSQINVVAHNQIHHGGRYASRILIRLETTASGQGGK